LPSPRSAQGADPVPYALATSYVADGVIVTLPALAAGAVGLLVTTR
jgi:hypothetical protein